jgi:hypothetical protein
MAAVGPLPIIAGHQFDSRGYCTAKVPSGDHCPIRWGHIRDATYACVDQLGIAHIAKLNAFELSQIQKAAAEERTACDLATAQACGIETYKDTTNGV